MFHECGAWRSLVAHLLWEQGVGGSNPLAPTTHAALARGPGHQDVIGRSRVFGLWDRANGMNRNCESLLSDPKIVQVNDSRL